MHLSRHQDNWTPLARNTLLDLHIFNLPAILSLMKLILPSPSRVKTTTIHFITECGSAAWKPKIQMQFPPINIFFLLFLSHKYQYRQIWRERFCCRGCEKLCHVIDLKTSPFQNSQTLNPNFISGLRIQNVRLL